MISATASIDFGTKRGAGTADWFRQWHWLDRRYSRRMTCRAELRRTPIGRRYFKFMLVGLIVSAIVLMPLWRSKPPAALTFARREVKLP